MRNVDFIIIGGGPAGAVFAKNLNKGFSACLIYSDVPKPCGGLLSEDAQKYFGERNIALPKEITADPQIFAVDTIDIGSNLSRRYQRFYINVDRLKFDEWLRGFIPERTETIRGTATKIEKKDDGFTVTYISGGEEFYVTGKYLVGADGANSIVRKTFFSDKKIRRYTSIQQIFEINPDAPNYACVFDKESTECCAWIIKKGGKMLFGGAFGQKNPRDSFELMKSRLEKSGIHLGDPIKTEACLVMRPKSRGQIFLGKDNVFLIGEAAGFISPSSFEGISKAMYSAEALAKAVNDKNPIKSYRKYASKLRMKTALKLIKCPFMYSPPLRKAVMKTGITAIKTTNKTVCPKD